MLSNIDENQTGGLSSLIMPLWVRAQNTDLLSVLRLQTISHGEQEETHSIIPAKPGKWKLVFLSNP